MFSDGCVVRDGQERRFRVYSNVPYEFVVSLSREDVVNNHFAWFIEHMQSCVLGGVEESIQQFKPMLGRKGKESPHRYR